MCFFFSPHAGSKRKTPVSSFTPRCAPALPSCRGQGAFSNWDYCCFVAGCTLGASPNLHRVQRFGVQGEVAIQGSLFQQMEALLCFTTPQAPSACPSDHPSPTLRGARAVGLPKERQPPSLGAGKWGVSGYLVVSSHRTTGNTRTGLHLGKAHWGQTSDSWGQQWQLAQGQRWPCAEPACPLGPMGWGRGPHVFLRSRNVPSSPQCCWLQLLSPATAPTCASVSPASKLWCRPWCLDSSLIGGVW